LFFQFALAAHLISADRPSNRTDISYLFYLPFCSLFISSDNLHRRAAKLFMRPEQEFVWGHDLKPGLKAVNAHFLQLPESERQRGIMSFANVPPEGNIVADLWDRHLRSGYREERQRPRTTDPEKNAELVARFKEFRKQETLPPEEAQSTIDDPEIIAVKRSVHRKRGSWWQVP
jgi:hypothetical protein